MKTVILCLVVLTSSLVAAPGLLAAPAGWSPLLEPRELAALRESAETLRILRVSGEHEAGHIPGAVPVSYARFRGPPDNPGALPALEPLTEVVRSLGLDGTQPVVVVHEGNGPSDMGTATRIYWTLKSLGVEDLAVLNGGFLAWKQAGLPVSTRPVSVARSDWSPRWRDDWRITTAEIEARLEDPEIRLIDSRPPAFFQGTESSIARPGTVRGASHLAFSTWFDGHRMKPPMELRQALAGSPLPQAPRTVTFCNTGHWASINWFVLSEIVGVPETRLYAESMAEWSRADRPMDNQPDRVAHYWDMTVQWLNGLRE